jgi:hypothetical protein
MFSFLEYGNAIQRMMQEWYNYTSEVLEQSSDLGSVREHFVKQILSGFLPRSVIVGNGEIISGDGQRSGQQDIIIYRSDFPVITSSTPVNTYLAEGVLATIEIKSNLSTGEPHLKSAFRSAKGALLLAKQARSLRGSREQVLELSKENCIRTYVIGYAGWKNVESLMHNYVAVGNEIGWLNVPHLVCQPGACVLRHDGFIIPFGEDSEKGKPILWVNCSNPFTVFLHHLLKAIMVNTGGAVTTSRDNQAAILYDLDPYFNFSPPLRFDRWPLTFVIDGSEGTLSPLAH